MSLTINPIYYTNLDLLQKEEQEILKMPPELAEVVVDLLKSILDRQKFYAGISEN